MLTGKEKMYVIPGWGFHADLFQESQLKNFNIVGLNYFNEKNQSIEKVAYRLSKNISNDSIILGWSLGGLIAIKLASLLSNKVKKLVLLASQPRLLEDSYNPGISYRLLKSFIKKIQLDFHGQKGHFISLVNYPNKKYCYKKVLDKYFMLHTEKVLSRQLVSLFYTNLTKEYESISTEILHIINKKDAIIYQDDSHLKLLNRNTTVVNIEQAGHSGFLTHGKLYQSIIEQFIAL